MRVLPLALAALLTACASAPAHAAARASRRGDAPHAIDVPQVQHPDGETAAWWYRAGAARAAGNGAMDGRARNVIMFLGDGMSLPTVAAARILAGQRAGQPGEETLLAFEQFPNTALSRTYNTDYQTPDSAGTMTAIATGVKTRLGVIGIGRATPRGDCGAVADNTLLSIIELGESRGPVDRRGHDHAPHACHARVGLRARARSQLGRRQLPAAQRRRRRAAATSPRNSSTSRFGDGIDSRARRRPREVHAEHAGRCRRSRAERPAQGRPQSRRGMASAHSRTAPTSGMLRNSRRPADAPRVLGLFDAAAHVVRPRIASPATAEPTLAEMTRAAIAHSAAQRARATCCSSKAAASITRTTTAMRAARWKKRSHSPMRCAPRTKRPATTTR